MVLSTRPLSTRHEVEDERAAQDFLHEKGWTDGLPVIPPTPERVLACLGQAVLAPDQVIGIEPVRARPITAEKAARSTQSSRAASRYTFRLSPPSLKRCAAQSSYCTEPPPALAAVRS